MQGLLRSGLMAFCAHSPRKIGRRDSREFASLFYSERIPLPLGSGYPSHHAVKILMEFLPTFGLGRSILPLNFPMEAADISPIPYVLIAPESSRSKKNWPHYEALTDHLCHRFPHWNFIWVGTVGNRMANWPPNFLDLRGKTSLNQLLGLINSCRGVISNDSGCSHLAAAVNKPILTLFCHTDPARFGPFPPDTPGHFTAYNPPKIFPELEQFLKFTHCGEENPDRSCPAAPHAYPAASCAAPATNGV
jgi:ADP-heptose:LPS heptosyltransferase